MGEEEEFGENQLSVMPLIQQQWSTDVVLDHEFPAAPPSAANRLAVT